MNRILTWLADTVERHINWTLAGLTLIYFLGTAGIAWTKLMWLDEISTYIPATYQGWSGLWRFFADGRDVHTPVAAALMRLSLLALGDNGWSIRFPFIFGYFLLFYGSYRFTAKRAGSLWGLVAGLFVLVTPTIEYATEARPYGLTMGLGAIAAVAWQELGESRRPAIWRTILALSLALGVSLHFFFLFVLVPLAGAEWWRWRITGRRDWWTGAIIFLAPAAYLPFVPGVLAARAIYAGNYWSKPQLSFIEDTYRFLLNLAFFPLLAALLAWAVNRGWQPAPPAAAAVEPPVPEAEWVLVTIWSLLPVWMVAGSFVLGAYVPRYALPAMGGLAILLAWVCWRRSGGDRTLALVLALVFLLWFGWKTPSTVRRQMAETGGYPVRQTDGFQPRKWYPIARDSNLPVLVTPAVLFTKINHYASEPLRRRLVYPASLREAIRFDGTDTGDRWLLQIASPGHFPVVALEEFLARNREFLVLADTSVPTWHLELLRTRGARVELLERDQAQLLLRVSLSAADPPPREK